MSVRNTGHPSIGAPGFTSASARLDAPAGTAIVGLRGRYLLNATAGWQAGIHDQQNNRWVWCGPGCLSTFGGWYDFNVGGLWTSRVAGLIICGSSSCSRAGSSPSGTMALSHVVATLSDEWAPNVGFTGGSLLDGGWRHEVQGASWDANDNTGIRRFRVLIDGQPFDTRDRSCDPHSSAPCGNGGGSLDVDTRAFMKTDGRHSIAVEALDGGYNAVTISRDVWVDNTAPAQPQEVVLEGGEAWRSTNRFKVTWTNPPQTASPIAGVRFRLCPENAPIGDESRCVRGERNGRDLRKLDDLQLPTGAAWRLQLWLRDEAGNEDPGRSVTLTGLRFDGDAPELRFLPQNEDDPARVRVKAADATSGLASTEVEIRRQGESVWRAVPTEPAPYGFSALIDDEPLPDGTYNLRARAVDHAGNERSSDRLQNGQEATLAVPVRIKTRLAVGRIKRVRARKARGNRRYRRVLIVRPQARFGRTIRLHGRLTSPGANPIADTDVEVWEKPQLVGAEFRRIATVKTSRTGRLTFKALPGPSRVLRFRYPGTSTVRGRTTEVDLRVRASTTLRVSRNSVVNGEYVTFRGKLRGGPLPPAGKLVELQVFTRGRWRTFAQPRSSNTTGRWAFQYRFEAIRGKARFRFRARVRKEEGFPYELGVSGRIRVTVRGV